MLGFSDAIRGSRGAYSQRGSGQIWMDDLACTGNETSIDQCNFPGWGIHNCYHYEDAIAVCDSKWEGLGEADGE